MSPSELNRETGAMPEDRAFGFFRPIAVVLAVVGLTAATASMGLAQSGFPNKPIRVLVGFAPGGPSDIIARIVGAKTSDILGQQIIIENKTGAGGLIATEALVHSPADGYTLLNTATSVAVNETMSKNSKYEFGKHFVAVALQAQTANILVVHPSLGIKTLAEFTALAKSKPGEVLYATAGRGTATHLTTELFNLMAGTKLMPVHYRGGGETVKDLVSGQIKVMFSSIAPVQQLVKEGRLIGIATTGLKRDPAFPELPTVDESGLKGFDVQLWIGLSAPAGTPPDIIKRLESANNQALNTPEVKKALTAQGFAPVVMTAQQFDAFYRSERDKWAKVIKASGMDQQ